jgi:hypothetical protein
MHTETSSTGWAEATFGHAQLGDERRTKRLVTLASVLAGACGASVAKATADDDGAHEGAYRLLRNASVDPTQVAEAGFRSAVARASSVETVLAIEDTSTLGYSHAVAKELGDLGGPENSKARGFQVHSVLLVDRDQGVTLGLAEQRYWMRPTESRGCKHHRRRRGYEDKESFKWQASSEALRMRFGEEGMSRVISVCDREADIYEYLANKIAHHERFVVRASWNRALDGDDHAPRYLWSAIEAARVIGKATVHVPQRAGRAARMATLTLRRASVKLRRPHIRSAALPRCLSVRIVLAREENAPAGVEPLEWLLLTSEPIARPDDVMTVLRTYRFRWRIEEFHKVWKSGVGVERCRMQSASNILRLAVILAFVATRVLQLRELFDTDPNGPCTQLLTDTEWKILWATRENSRLPKKPPTVQWAYHAIGRLGGWYDSKRTGRVGPQALMEGWARLAERIAGYEASHLINGVTREKK